MATAGVEEAWGHVAGDSPGTSGTLDGIRLDRIDVGPWFQRRVEETAVAIIDGTEYEVAPRVGATGLSPGAHVDFRTLKGVVVEMRGSRGQGDGPSRREASLVSDRGGGVKVKEIGDGSEVEGRGPMSPVVLVGIVFAVVVGLLAGPLLHSALGLGGLGLLTVDAALVAAVFLIAVLSMGLVMVSDDRRGN